MERLFGLDAQLLFDTCLSAIAILVLFTALSYLLFEPARKMLKGRQERISTDIAQAQKEKEDALSLKAEYDARLNNIEKEADEIISDARKRGMKNEAKIVEEAKKEAVRIIRRAKDEAELEKKHAVDDMKKEMIAIASLMAGKAVASSMTPQVQESLLNDTLKEMGDETWLS